MGIIVRMTKDGNCLFRAIAHQINNVMGLTFDHVSVRKDLASYVREHRNDDRIRLALLNNIQEFFPNSNLSQEQRITKYITMQFNKTFWGGEDILIAASEFYLVNLHVHTDTRHTLVYSPTGEPVPGNIHIRYKDQHYDSWVMTEDEHYNSNPIDLMQKSNNVKITQHNKPITNQYNARDKQGQPIIPQSQTNSPQLASVGTQYEQQTSMYTQVSDVVADATGFTILRNQPTTAIKYTCSELRIATWNVRGASKPTKKKKKKKLTLNSQLGAFMQPAYKKQV